MSNDQTKFNIMKENNELTQESYNKAKQCINTLWLKELISAEERTKIEYRLIEKYKGTGVRMYS